MKKLMFTLILTILFSAASAQAQVDRSAMVEAVNSRLAPLLTFFKSQSRAANLPDHEKKVIDDILVLLKLGQIKLEFTSDQSKFKLRQGEPTRLMSTDANDRSGVIYVNLELLNQVGADHINLELILINLFHEYGHKVGDVDLAVRDRLAQMFAATLGAYIRTYKAPQNIEVVSLSIPSNLIQDKLEEVSINRPQPSNILLVMQNGKYFDLTEVVEAKVGETSTNLRELFIELNQFLYKLGNELAGLVNHVQTEMMKGLREITRFFGMKDPEDPLDLKEFFPLSELRNFNIKDVEIIDVTDSNLISIRGTYTIYRSNESGLTINTSGFEFKDRMEVPIQVHIKLPLSPIAQRKSLDISVKLRQDIDFQHTAKASRVLRVSGDVSEIAIRIPKAVSLTDLRLIAAFGSNYLSIAPSSEIHDKGDFIEVKFEIPASVRESGEEFFAESVRVSTDKTLYLEHLVALNKPKTIQPKPAASLVEGSIGFWGMQNGQFTFKTDFPYGEPSYFIDALNLDKFSFNPSLFAMDFKVLGNPTIREVRVHGSRWLFLGKSQESPPNFQEIPGITKKLMKGETSLIKTETTKEVFTIVPGPNARFDQVALADGEQIVRVQTRIPYRFVKPDADLAIDEVQAPPVFVPFMIEIVTEDFQVLTHHFGRAIAEPVDNCRKILGDIKDKVTEGIAKEPITIHY